MPNDRPNMLVKKNRAQIPGYVQLFTLVLLFGVGAGLSWFYLSSQQVVVSEKQSVATAAIDQHVPPVDAFASTTLLAEGAMVIDLSNNKVLYEKNPDAQLPLASLTKVPMAYVVSHALPQDSIITIPYDTAPANGSTQFIKGEEWHVQDVIDLTLVASSNDGADILASAANDAIHSQFPESPKDSATVWKMNDLAHELHLTNTYFINPDGLDESSTQAGAYGSARDMAHLFAYAASTSPHVYAATTHDKVERSALDGTVAVAQNTDLALDAIPGVIMGKTGYTDLAGGNLVVVFDVEPHHPIVITVMHSTEEGRFDDMKKLVAATQKQFILTQSTSSDTGVVNGIQ